MASSTPQASLTTREMNLSGSADTALQALAHSTISGDTEIVRWVQVGEQLLDLVSRVDFLWTGEKPKVHTLVGSREGIPDSPSVRLLLGSDSSHRGGA